MSPVRGGDYSALKELLKDYHKALYRNQPDDVLKWSAQYFERLTSLKPAVEEEEEEEDKDIQAIQDNSGQRLKLSHLKNLFKKLLDERQLRTSELRSVWQSAGLSYLQLHELITVGKLNAPTIQTILFLAVCCATLSRSLNDAVILFVSQYHNIDGKGIPVQLLLQCVQFLCVVDGDVPNHLQENAKKYLVEKSSKNGGFILANHVKSSSFPVLDS